MGSIGIDIYRSTASMGTVYSISCINACFSFSKSLWLVPGWYGLAQKDETYTRGGSVVDMRLDKFQNNAPCTFISS